MFIYFLLFQACNDQQSPEDFGNSYCQLIDDCELLSTYQFESSESCITEVTALPSIQQLEQQQQQDCISLFNKSECSILYSEEGLGNCDPN